MPVIRAVLEGTRTCLWLQNEVVSNHDELMCNFFAQADALANGKSDMELRSEQVPEYLVPHKTFTGNRPSLSIMMPDCTAYTVGQLLALYELRIGVQATSPPSPELLAFFWFTAGRCRASTTSLDLSDSSISVVELAHHRKSAI